MWKGKMKKSLIPLFTISAKGYNACTNENELRTINYQPKKLNHV